MASSGFSVASIISVLISYSVGTVGDDIVFPSFRKTICLIAYLYVLTLVFLLLFCLIKFTASIPLRFLLGVRISGLMVPKMGF